MAVTLGLSAYYHDSAAAIVADGKLIAAAQEERFSRLKHDASFPSRAVDYCLREAGVTIGEVDHIGFYERPISKFDRLLETHLATVPHHPRSFRTAMGPWLAWKMRMAARIRRELSLPRRYPLHFCDHHHSHAVSAFDCSPFDRAAIVTIDAVGQWATTMIFSADRHAIRPLVRMDFPHSLGLVYSTFTAFAGFRVNDGEYKLMGLAPLGVPRFAGLIEQELLRPKRDGSFQVAHDAFDFTGSESMFTERFKSLLGVEPREPGSPIRPVDRDIAASIQQVTETILCRIAAHARQLTGHKDLCLAGGVALNCAATGRLLREGIFDDVWIQPAAGDAGGAIGIALEIERRQNTTTAISYERLAFDNHLGPRFSDAEIANELDAFGACYQTCDDSKLAQRTAELLRDGAVVGWFQGRMEFGPRALGSRSILADPRDPGMQRKLNLKIKNRESFRPFAPVVLQSKANDWFDVTGGNDRPFMTFVFPVHEDKRARLPAVTHVDGTARVQTLNDQLPADDQRHERLIQLLQQFDRLTGVPVLINTSFNVADEPIVCSPADAVSCFLATQMDALVIGNHLLLKSQQQIDSLASSQHEEPQRVTWFQRLSQATDPLRNVVEGVLITSFYFLILTPMGLVLRGFGYDPLRQRLRTSEQSMWVVAAKENSDAPEVASTPRFGILSEFLQFLKEEKKWWLAPLLVMIALLSLLVAVSASPVGPFIYTLF